MIAPVTPWNSDRKAACRDIQERADSVKNRAKMQEIHLTLQEMKDGPQDPGSDEHIRFTRIIRDGVADEVRSALLESKRILEQHEKLGRLTQESQKWHSEFQRLADLFLDKKHLLEKLEKSIDTLRDTVSDKAGRDAAQLSIDLAVENSREERQNALEAAEKLIQAHLKLERQIRKDRERETGIQAILNQCLAHLPPDQRRKVSSLISSKTEGMNLEHRLKFLTKFIGELAKTVPAIRQEEMARLMQAAKEKVECRLYREAIPLLDQVFQYDKKHLDGHRLRAQVYLGMGNRFAHLCELRMIAEIECAEASDYYALAVLLEKDGQLDDALQLYERAVEKKKRRKYLEPLGDLSCQKRQWFRAVQAYRTILQMSPHLTSIKHKLGHALFESNREEEAHDLLSQAMKEKDNNGISQMYLGRIYRKRLIIDRALNCFARAVQMDPACVDARYWWGMLLFDRGEFAEAEKKAQEAVRLEPQRSRNPLLLARCMEALGKGKEGLDLLEPFLRETTPPVDVLLAYAEFCRRAGLLNRSLPVLETVLRKYPRQPQLRAEYGLQLLQSSRYSEAAEYLSPGAGFR